MLYPLQGMLKGDDLSAAYASADAFVMPSESETLGFVAMEAMSSGLPVVAVAAGGLVDIMKDCDGVTGVSPRRMPPQIEVMMSSSQLNITSHARILAASRMRKVWTVQSRRLQACTPQHP